MLSLLLGSGLLSRMTNDPSELLGLGSFSDDVSWTTASGHSLEPMEARVSLFFGVVSSERASLQFGLLIALNPFSLPLLSEDADFVDFRKRPVGFEGLEDLEGKRREGFEEDAVEIRAMASVETQRRMELVVINERLRRAP